MFFFFLALFCISIFLVGKLIAPFFASIVLGIVITGIFKPVYKSLIPRFSPKLASVLTCTAIFFVVFIPVVFFVGILSKEALGLYNMAKDAVFSNQLINLLENTRALERLNLLLAKAGIERTVSWNELIAPVADLSRTLGFSLFQQAEERRPATLVTPKKR